MAAHCDIRRSIFVPWTLVSTPITCETRHGERPCRNDEPYRRRSGTDARANQQPRRRASSYVKKFAMSAAASMERDRRNRRSRSVCQKRGVREFPFDHPGKARRKRKRAEAPSTRMRQVKANEKRPAGRACRVPYPGPSRENLEARPHARHCRNKLDGPRRAVQRRPARRQLARRPRPRDRRGAPQPQKRRPEPGHVANSPGRYRCPEDDHGKAKPIHPNRDSRRMRREPMNAISIWLVARH